MDNNVEKLKRVIGKNNRMKRLLLTIMRDDQWVAKSVKISKKKFYKLLDEAEFEKTENSDNQIAYYILQGLKDVGNGDGALGRGNIIISTVCSFMNEHKDDFDPKDYAEAVAAIRTLGPVLFSSEVLGNSMDSRIDEGVKGFTPGKKGGIVTIVKKVNSFANDLEKATELVTKGIESDSEEEIACAERIRKIVETDLKNKCGCRSFTFSNWAAEQIYRMSPSIKELIEKHSSDVDLVENMFSEWLKNLKATDMVEYLKYVDDVSNGVAEEKLKNASDNISIEQNDDSDGLTEECSGLGRTMFKMFSA